MFGLRNIFILWKRKARRWPEILATESRGRTYSGLVYPPQMGDITDGFDRIVYIQFFKDSLTVCIYCVDTACQLIGNFFARQAVAY